MTTDGTLEGTPESGGALRAQLENTIAENRALRETLATSVVSNFQYVKPEDLKDVAPSELHDRAAQIEQERVQARNSVVTEELKGRGWTDVQIEEFLSAGKAPENPAPQSAPPRLGNIGTPPARPKAGTEDGLYGPSRIRASMGD